MNPPPLIGVPHAPALPASFSPELLTRQWQALHRAAGVVAGLAGVSVPALAGSIADFPEAIADTGGWRYNLAHGGIADLAAVMEPGLTALIAIHARGADARAAAQALLEEFVTARDGLLALAPARRD